VALVSPYQSSANQAKYRDPPADERCYRTFCGT